MQLVHASKHLGNVVSGVFFFEYSRVVEKRAEVTTWDVLHRQVYVFGVLESV
jgi:hypothetical protein